MDERAVTCPRCGVTYEDEQARFCVADGTPLTGAAAASWLGRTIDGRYRIERRLGSGGMADVYEATHLFLERPVALKLLKASLVGDLEAVDRFRQEARVVALLNHPNVVSIDDSGRLDDGTFFLAMELLKGRSLDAILEEGAPDPADALDWLVQACAGLAVAHDRGVVHRDIKPGNLFLHDADDGPIVKILDFGIAKLQDERAESNLTRTGTIFGTPHYMSPEQAVGGRIDPSSDVYSLGVVAFEVLAGRLPFDAESFVGVLTKHVSELPRWPADAPLGDDRYGSLREVVLKALAKNPTQRYRTARELGEALAALREDVDRFRSRPRVATSRLPIRGGAARSTVPVVSLDEAATVPVQAAIRIAPGVHWVGARDGSKLERNSYLLSYEGEGRTLNVLIDPGPPRDLRDLSGKVAAVVGSLADVDLVFINHQDPDVCLNTTAIQELNPRAHLWCSEDTWRLACFYGFRPGNYSAIEHFRDRRTRLATGHDVVFVPTPYCHERGAVMYYDPASRVLFTGDLFGGLSRTGALVAEKEDWPQVALFHQIYMPSRRALDHAVACVRALDPAPLVLAPQHGGIWRGDRIAWILDQVAGLDVGVDLVVNEQTQSTWVDAVNDLVGLLDREIGTEPVGRALRSFGQDGSFPNLFRFDLANRVTEIRVDPRAAVHAFLDNLDTVVPERAAGLRELARATLELHGLAASVEESRGT